jgi:DNA-binding beta-propeller fold protein YncE
LQETAGRPPRLHSGNLGIWGDYGNLYICENVNRRIRAVNFFTKKISTIAGGGLSQFGKDPLPALDVQFIPKSIWGDEQGNLYILTYRQLLLFSDNTIQLFAYSDSGAQKTGSDGSSVDFLDLAMPVELLHITGDVKRNCLYISEMYDSQTELALIVRKLDLKTKTATIFAGHFGEWSSGPYIDGVLATAIKFSPGGPAGLWVSDDGTVFVADPIAATISAINPDTNEIRWFAGSWNDGGFSIGRADQDLNNELNVLGGPATLGKIVPSYLAGNSRLNTLYVVDQWHSTVRKISPVFAVSAAPVHRKLEEAEIISAFYPRLSNKNPHLRGDA